MADNTHMYREIRDALKSQIEGHLNSLGEEVDVYKSPRQNIPRFPAVAIELDKRRKPKKGVGVKQLELDLFVWVYVDIYDLDEAEDECFRLSEIVEDAIELDKTLSGEAHYLSLDSEAQFGAVETGTDSFLQGARILVTVKKRFS